MRLASPSVLRGRLCMPFRRFYSSSRTIQENDVLFLRQQGKRAPKWHLTAPLRADSRIRLSYGGSVNSSDLIGRSVLDTVVDSSGRSVVLHEPSMASYIINSARYATPIYPHDANIIVSLLDLNLPRPGEEEYDTNQTPQPFEIFEAGTGMGSLTLHLARALHAGNPAVPPSLRNALCSARYKRDEFGLDLSPEVSAEYETYRNNRRAILHTLDRNHKHSRAAHSLIRQFRRALYFPTVDFHIGSIDEYISSRLAQTDNEPFLSHAILDLPSAHDHAGPVIQALQPNGLLIIFTPSISQIADFQAWILRSGQPIRPERVIELPVSTTADGVRDTGGGKEWDVKTVIPKDQPDGSPVQVMRPRVGDRIAGGGFVAVMRRWPAGQVPSEAQSLGDEAVSELDELTGTDEVPESEKPSETS
ncbi:TRNA (adenine(58)-N(1))-methyltransferase catalytic subunit TRM61 [Fusarium keratoplasticum]|uniref:tRNA (Adenine(58)-N(1))-methyltransferase catalytic subunit TRM61 n=1 Tax=Fusarium keratoplasticum TaxID=1328300 RepID=A0ACC0QHQ3_9HYPO|nr:TRNA (adenine(58)-N(1))-methyltransferase catalytic subunit TRM61 [Fusarium keratoplasticum]KAI8655052.1 TRNA (adenine(58)-N(1))-methyltransferase catalytic subunit TRM61 [Fusarium keratoplasticum]KAI8655896.1 TRNA (adenine(58)-N(1))-methyltransferase catalytic subunit TRM61 [Fusarium keratoplasticum]